MPQVLPLHVVGVNDLLKGLNYIDEDMKQKITAAIRPAMLGIRNKARGFVPSNGEVLSGWTKEAKPQAGYRPFPRFDSARAKGGIDYREGENKTFKNGFRVSNYVYNVNPGGSIYETAGRLNPQGRAPIMRVSSGEGGSVEGYEGKSRGRRRSTKTYSSANPFAGYQFVTDLPPVTSQPKMKDVRSSGRKTKGRLIYRAWAEDSGKVYNAILQAVNAAVDNFNDKTKISSAA
jgi:hypothetical protein